VERPVEKHLEWVAGEARKAFGVEVTPAVSEVLARFVGELIRWNRRFNLTSITDPAGIAEKHLLDSLAIVPHVPEGADVLDAGTGGGFPGVPLAVLRPDVRVVLVDRTEKKVLFLQTALATLGIENATAVHARLEGRPEEEHLGPVDLAVSRAFVAPEEWLRFGSAYVRPGGRVVAMLGAEDPAGVVSRAGLSPPEVAFATAYRLPSGDRRGLVVRQVGGSERSEVVK
jgi:16S rRNA (guanine527-N7)-methyltransferase